jgi:hypothetical protein
MTREIKALFDCRGIGPDQVALFMTDGLAITSVGIVKKYPVKLVVLAKRKNG